MRINVPMLNELEEHTASVREKALRAVKRVTGDRWFNPGSGDQVAAWLYSLKGLPVKRRTESGRGSTSDETLQMLRGYHAHDEEVATFITGVQDYREADKYLGTFIAPIFLYMRRDKHGNWRVHPNFRITRVVSGRLSSFDPNVLAFPTRTELGKRIRYCFEAQEGYVIVSADASQIELRMMAHLCGDWKMREAFENGTDLHSLTASIVFKIPLSEILEHKDGIHSAKRYVAKTINFAVMYGITAQALLEQLFKANIFDYTLEDCEKFIREWFNVFPAVQRFLRQLWKQAAKDGFVRDMWGRICYIPNLNVMDTQMRAAAERLCGNFPVSGAHGIVKRGEIRLWDWINEDDDRYDHILPWLQMHDELDLEVRADLAEETERKVISYMEQDAHMFKVPIVAEGRKKDKKTGKPKPFAKSWGDAK
jgi:DNA polymerase-1